MSAVSGTVGATPAVVGGRTVAAVAAAELRYAARSPLVVLGAVAYAVLALSPLVNDDLGATLALSREYVMWDWISGPLVFAAFVAANLAALRERPDTTGEMFISTPARRWERTVAVLTAAVVPAGAALVITAARALTIAVQGGVVEGDPPYTAAFTPTPLEVLGAPLLVAVAWIAGVALARLIGSRVVGVLVGVVGWLLIVGAFWIWYIAPTAYVALWRNALVTIDLGTAPSSAELDRYPAVQAPNEFVPSYIALERDLVLYSVHLAFVVGVALTLSGIALWRSGRDRRTWWLLAPGPVLAVGAVLWQLFVFDGSVEWLGS